MARTMHLEILTPDELILNTDVDAIRVQLSDGWWGILPGHAPFLAHIVAGIMLYRQHDDMHYVALYQGTVEVQRPPDASQPDRVLVLTAAVEVSDNLAELEHALELQRAQMNQTAREAHIEFTRARMALERALKETTGLSPVGPTLI
jgi:F-type H+-transporting ATPase subunit epsilon